jgi:glycosyltransferase involved in cell wall biosynthesis
MHVITPHRFGGAEHVLAHLAAAQIARGHTVHIVMPARLPDFQEYARRLGVPVVTAPIAGKLNVMAPARIVSLARELRCDVLHSHLSSASMHAIRAGRRAGIPVVAHIHALSSPRWYRGADLVLTCSQAAAAHVRKRGLGGTPVQVIYNGILPADASSLRPPEEVKRDLGIPEDAPIVGSVAALIPRKGHIHLLQAASLLSTKWPNLVLVFVGSGPLYNELHRIAENLGVENKARILGWREDKMDIVRCFTVVAIPSVAVDGFSMTALEAAQFGIPAVASDWPGIDEAVIHGKTGLLVPPGQSDALARALDQILSHAELRGRLGEQARRRLFAELTIDRMAENLDNVYLELTQRVRFQ